MNTNLKHKDVWTGQSPSGLIFEICHWGADEKSRINNGYGTWNFYIYIREDQTKDFEKLWLPDIVKEFTEGSGRFYLTHDYYDLPIADADWHCGITYYEKGNEQVPGRRYVKVGCDYSHLYDQGRHDLYDVDYITRDALRCCESIAKILEIVAKD